ncbi:MAG: Gfo/Idh/MocA family oxidoreductase [Pirellulales bacterium]|nr:Gfo/Idh/MocA family oxidoreductase [Pirellulales bacterium]
MTCQTESSSTSSRKPTRREALATGGKAAAGIAVAALAPPHVHAAEDNTIRLALIGCGGRGSGAAGNALSVPDGGPVKLFAMADLFENRLAASHKALSQRFAPQVDVPPERRLVGFGAYRRAIDLLRPGDVAMLTGYAGWRPLQLEYAVAKGIHVFMEKSFATDPPGVRRIIAASEAAEKKNLKIAAGLMCRHSPARHELIRRIRDGALGEIQLIRGYRMQPVGPMGPKPDDVQELHWQIRNFTRFFWVSGGLYAEMDIHQIDEICWLKDALPVSAHGIGGRAPDSTDRSQNLDSHHVEYTFADGAKALFDARYLSNCFNEFATFVHGSKRAAQFSGQTHAPTVHTYRDQRVAKDNIDWRAEADPYTPWQAEWNALIAAIRGDTPHNEARRAALSNLADIMGRAAIHSGKIVTWDEAYESDFQWCPGLDRLADDTPPPVQPDAAGRYPAPTPGTWIEL